MSCWMSFRDIFSECNERIRRAKKKPYWIPLTKTVKFIVHFFVVMLLLFCSAQVFARLEDPDVMYGKNNAKGKKFNTTTYKNATNETTKNMDWLNLWKTIESKHNFTVPAAIQDDLIRYTERLVKERDSGRPCGSIPRTHHLGEKVKCPDKEFVFMKWFYFTIISTTTIGYGQVYPETNNGKLFYIGFSIVGIVLMMTLLRSCGKILMTGNKMFYTWVCRWILRNDMSQDSKQRYVSDELISVVSMVLLFLLFMMLVIWHDKNIGEVKDWHFLDTCYFWLVTFTTVGFGDVHFPLEVEIEHFYELVLYRVFGLSFLSGIIESIHVYFKMRKRKIVEKQKKRLRKLSHMIIGTATPLGLTAGFISGEGEDGKPRESKRERKVGWRL